MVAAGGPGLFRVVVLSGPSGSGKTTVVERLVAESPIRMVKSVSATTRQPRPGEVPGESYYFLTAEDFAARKERGEFLETAEVYGAGYWYGTLRSEIERAKQAGGWAFLEIDVQGALRVMELFPDALTIFLTTPSDDVFEQRLRARGTESEETIQKRMRRAQEELQFSDRYRYRVINDQLDRAVREILDIFRHEAATDAGSALRG